MTPLQEAENHYAHFQSLAEINSLTGFCCILESMKKISEISVTKKYLYQKKDDFSYWQTRSRSERLTVLEEIRQEYHQWRYGAEPRFQRVYSIIKRG